MYFFGRPFSLFFASLMIGCTSIPCHRVIDQEIEVAVAVDAALQSEAFIDLPWPEEGWWKLFNDPTLECLLAKAIEYNPQIEQAMSRVREAGDQVQLAKTLLYPIITGFSDIVHVLYTRTGVFPPNAHVPYNYNQTDFYLNLNYELDLWEKNRNTVRAEKDLFLAEQFQANLATLILTIRVAETYFSLKTTLQIEDIARRFVTNRAYKMQLIKLKVENKLENQLTYLSAEQDFLTATKSLREAERARALNEHALYSLVAEGVPLPCIDPYFSVEDLFPFPLPECLALDVLSRRPDIQQSLWDIKAAGRKIKIAQANFYPNINLMGILGYSTIFPHKLFSPKSSTYQIGPAGTLPIFPQSGLQAEFDITVEDFRQTVEQYNLLILNAVQEVKDSLTTVDKLNQEWLATMVQISDANASLELVQKRLAWLSSMINYLDQEAFSLNTESEKARIEGQIVVALLEMIRVLGG